MSLVAAKCTQCGANIEVNNETEAAICPSCHTPFITEKAINNYITNNNTFSTTNVTKNTSINTETVYMADEREFVIVAGELREYRGECTNVVIPEGVTKIGDKVFAEMNITGITIPNSVTAIGKSAFDGCTRLTNVYITDIAKWCEMSFEHLDANPLHYTKNLYINDKLVTDIIIPDSVTRISGYAFCYCSSLTSVTIPHGVTSIGEYAFSNCISLTSVDIPNSVTNIEDLAFSGCKNLAYVTIGNSLKNFGTAFDGCTSLTSITIPDGVTSIADNAFFGCISLESIVIPNSVTSIGEKAFYGCTALTSIVIPDSVTSIGVGAFYGCTSLADITVPFLGEKNDGTGSILLGFIFRESKYYDSNWDVPPSIKTVKLTSATFIGEGAFHACGKLTSVVIPDSVTSIDHYAFSGCTSLTSVTIGNGVTSIGVSAFEKCTSLENITIPNSIISISGSAFYYCSNLKTVYVTKKNKKLIKKALKGSNIKAKIIVN